MKLVSRMTPALLKKWNETQTMEEKDLCGLVFCMPNGADALWSRPEPEDLEIVVDRQNLKNPVEGKTDLVRTWTSVKDTPLRHPHAFSIRPAASIERTCVLMNTSMIDEKWVRPALKPLLAPDDEVSVLAFSFFDDTKTLEDWNRQYKKGQGIWYRSNTDVFFAYGLKEKQIHWVNYFTDSIPQMKEAILNSSVLLLTGGAPDLMYRRIREKKLSGVLRRYQGLVIGYSAGAMIQLGEYHITPDEDYPQFCWKNGLGYLTDFDVEVHFQNTPHQLRHIERALRERHRPVYAIDEKGGMIVQPDGTKSFFGAVTCFDPKTK